MRASLSMSPSNQELTFRESLPIFLLPEQRPSHEHNDLGPPWPRLVEN